MGGFLSTNQWTLTIISVVAAIVAAIIGLFLSAQARSLWYWVIAYLVLYILMTVFFYKAFAT